ncbi:thiamine biosynthesis protein ThiS [Xylanimonas cellulosilytica DSM 15894]|uniref:Thiamine biosynthesis protein ThiS n=1 Tax=Xylanimonas cellulosilytica (strain DSM 15894 / JCM 12276 / CECT 5975 / KCTC 9989 / LMG 20990 / NBRC 107835 / XIL07) TaxID=446471 RepID=D1BRZ6_XYLCX|nr:sulfur carrier protein ThiS [Xylanimonas cellulosilytica]ACZ30488.1 thiamine biosynthesis protein ThiS [Xylanimonas cellulosilytica DSM 15894]
MTAHPAHVNGEPRPDVHGSPLDALVVALVPDCVVDGAPRGVAVAVNDAVVPRGAWTSTVVAAGDRVEVVTAVQGG